MTTVTLWLLIHIGSFDAPTYTVERFSSQAECVRVQKVLEDVRAYVPRLRCVQATVVRP